jgi:HAD superfamily hydrolase (TIGR01509 family)
VGDGIEGVLIDFSGTLFRLQINTTWLEQEHGAEQAELLRQVITAPVGSGAHLPQYMVADWERRDLDPEIHEIVYTESLRRSGLTEPGQAEAAYRTMLEPASWEPYPDTPAMLERLRDAGIPVAVVSNIAWDVRTSFDRFGLTGLVTDFVLSFQEGSTKPDEKIFRIACDRIGVEPRHVLMIGDSVEADGGAAALGCQVEIVEALPTEQRPDALLAALARHGL